MALVVESRTDTQIQQDVLAELKWEPRVQSTEIGVTVKDGIVTLTGFVDSYMKKWAAEEAAHRVRGVKAVANDIEVRLPSSSERTDADIAAAAVRALDWDALLEDGGERVIMATDRYISFWEAWVRPRTIDYPFTVIEPRLGPNGEGEGKMSLATKTIYDKKDNVVVLENYGIQPQSTVVCGQAVHRQ